ncbi:polymorphic toxin type 44 domain-containing protein [Pseudomonas sp. W2Oct36]|uniref:polymorphic toxin type 44 domain-containing protein n=1 Tax=unclassified Pseudomonas TaxID=196821 RepID=UPI0034E05D6B
MSFELPQAMPRHVNVDVNIKLANEQWRKDPAIGAFMSWFYYKVRNGGPWDFKQKHPEWENFGNFHYGAVGRGGQLPDQILLRAAGFAQQDAGTQSTEEDWGVWYWRAPYGDDPKDQYWIMQGIEYAKSKGY